MLAPSMTTCLYLSASITNAALNRRLRVLLPSPRFEVILPQEFTPDVPHHELPRAIYERCIAEMERCDAGLLLLDAFGVDCASEAGWFAAKQKPLIGVAHASSRFLQHWMVKGTLSGTICLDPVLYAELQNDTILRGDRSILCEDPARLGDCIEALLQRVPRSTP
jgi:nucleoside 2-deoxyribosyltransferase